MDYQKVTGFVNSGQFCIWCSCHYPMRSFSQSIDVCSACESFRQKHHYDMGNFFTIMVDDSKYRVFLRYDKRMTNSQVREYIKMHKKCLDVYL